MSAKSKRGEYEPSWTEVTIGALLSAVIGATLGVAYLVTKPVITVKVLPEAEEISPGATYFIEGAKDAAKARLAGTKRKSFAAGGSVTVDENELNSLAGSVAAPGASAKPTPAAKGAKAAPPAVPGAKTADKPAAAASGFGLSPGNPNFRIRDGELQIGLPVRIEAFGYGLDVIMQIRGQFAKAGDVFVFEAGSMTVGSCPLDRLPGATTWVAKRVLSAVPVPDDITKVWGKLADVAVVDSTVRLTMP